VNHPDIPTIYPPIAVALFALFGALARGVLPMKLLALLGHLACIPVVGALAPPDDRARARWLFALHPLALVESALAGHVDAFAGLGIALAVFALGRERPGRAALGALVAVGTKLVGLLLVPLIAARSRRAALACAVAGAILVVPLALAGRGSGVPGGLSEYARRWQGNAALFALVEGGFETALQAAAGPGRQTIWLGPLARLPGLADARPKKAVNDPDRVSIARVAGLATRAVLGVVVLVAALALARRGLPPLVAARLTVLLALLCAPQVHPWYLLWLLPLEIASGGLAGQVWAAAIVVAYAPLDRWIAARAWVEPPFALGAQLAVITLALGFEWRRRAQP
jgi:hypothetical protein